MLGTQRKVDIDRGTSIIIERKTVHNDLILEYSLRLFKIWYATMSSRHWSARVTKLVMYIHTMASNYVYSGKVTSGNADCNLQRPNGLSFLRDLVCIALAIQGASNKHRQKIGLEIEIIAPISPVFGRSLVRYHNKRVKTRSRSRLPIPSVISHCGSHVISRTCSSRFLSILGESRRAAAFCCSALLLSDFAPLLIVLNTTLHVQYSRLTLDITWTVDHQKALQRLVIQRHDHRDAFQPLTISSAPTRQRQHPTTDSFGIHLASNNQST